MATAATARGNDQRANRNRTHHISQETLFQRAVQQGSEQNKDLFCGVASLIGGGSVRMIHFFVNGGKRFWDSLADQKLLPTIAKKVKDHKYLMFNICDF